MVLGILNFYYKISYFHTTKADLPCLDGSYGIRSLPSTFQKESEELNEISHQPPSKTNSKSPTF